MRYTNCQMRHPKSSNAVHKMTNAVYKVAYALYKMSNAVHKTTNAAHKMASAAHRMSYTNISLITNTTENESTVDSLLNNPIL